MAGNESRRKEEEPPPRPLVILKPGVGEYRHTFAPIEKSLASSGLSVFVDEHPEPGRVTELREEFARAKSHARTLYAELYPGRVDDRTLNEMLENIPLSLFREALSVIRLVEGSIQSPEEKIVLAGHSQGAAAATAAAFLRPDLAITKLVLMNPAGWTGKRERPSPYLEAAESINAKKQKKLDALFGSWRATALFVRASFAIFVAETLRSIFHDSGQRARILATVQDSFDYLSERIGNGQVFAEAHGLANFDALPYLDLLYDVTGVTVSVIYDEDDLIFPARRIRGRIEEGGGKRGWITLHKTKGFGHYGPVKNPEYFAELISELVHT